MKTRLKKVYSADIEKYRYGGLRRARIWRSDGTLAVTGHWQASALAASADVEKLRRQAWVADGGDLRNVR